MKFTSFGLFGLSLMGIALSVSAQTEPTQTPVLICRAQQCAEARYSMTKGFLYNKIAQMMKKNENKDVLICEADPISHVCLSEGIVIPAYTPLDKINIAIDKLHLSDAKLTKDSALDLVFDYKIRANQTYPRCQLGLSTLNVASTNNVELLTQDFGCDITETGHTSLNASYDINYLDFDYGFIGAYYTIGVGETTTGDKTGYALMRFTERVPLTKTAPAVELPPNATVLAEGESTAAKVVAGDKTTTVVNDTAPASSTVIQQVAAPKTTVIRTKTVEKMTINSDGSRQVEPPETRTVVEELNK